MSGKQDFGQVALQNSGLENACIDDLYDIQMSHRHGQLIMYETVSSCQFCKAATQCTFVQPHGLRACRKG